MNSSSRDIFFLFVSRILRMFSYGFLALVLVLYLSAEGLSGRAIGVLFAATLLGDAAITLFLSTRADCWGRRKTLRAGAVLILFGGLAFAFTRRFDVLFIAAIVGVISPSGYEVGPFKAVEQAALAQIIEARRRTHLFAWYNIAGTLATGLGSMYGGLLVRMLSKMGIPDIEAYRVLILIYAASGIVLWLFSLFLSVNVEVRPDEKNKNADKLQAWHGLHTSRRIIGKLSALFALDAFAGGFVVQSFLSYWFLKKFGADVTTLGAIFLGANILSAASNLLAPWLASRIGLVNTMVFTHLPSNVLLMLVPLMPSLPWAVGLLLIRFSISQMDVPTRQAYVMAVVQPDERSAAAGITAVARTMGLGCAPLFAGFLFANVAWMSWPLYLAGGMKIVYDLLLYQNFRALKPEN